MGKTNGFLSFANTFPTEQSCIEYYEQIRWNGKENDYKNTTQ